jgi:hypothetical protein
LIADFESLNIEYSAIYNLQLTNQSRNLQSAISISQNIRHRVPADPSDQPAGCNQSASCKPPPVPRRVRQLDRIRRGIETNRVDTRDGARTRG